jgi:hypothetical protein
MPQIGPSELVLVLFIALVAVVLMWRFRAQA